jgi:rubrerythrin
MQPVLDVRDVFLYAVRGEKASFALYTSAAARAHSPEVAGILDRLARDELGHLFTLLRRFGALHPGMLDAVDITVPAPDPGRVERLSRAASALEVLRDAVEAERASLAAYAQLRPVANAGARTVLQAIMRRERRHVALLQALLNTPMPAGLMDARSAH